MSDIRVRGCGREDVAQLATLGRDVFRRTYGDSASPGQVDEHVEEFFGDDAVARDITRSAMHGRAAPPGSY